MMFSPRKQVVYFVRHAEATHNIKEREAIQAAIDRGIHAPCEHEKARRAILQDESLLDAPLSPQGMSQAERASQRLDLLFDKTSCPPPTIVLVSPLRRALMTATELFRGGNARFVALEMLREKRTGFAADERLPVAQLMEEFPHVDFDDLLKSRPPIAKGEDNGQVQQRGRIFLEEYLSRIPDESVAIVTHKAWLREMRKTLKEWVDHRRLEVDYDLDQWHQTLFGNMEVRVAEFGWVGRRLVNIVSRSVDNALALASTAAESGAPLENPDTKGVDPLQRNAISLLVSTKLRFQPQHFGLTTSI